MKDHESTHFGFKKIPIREKAGKVAEVFHSVATKYDLMNDVMSLGSHRLMKQLTVEHTSARKGHKILDLAGGTGDLTARLSPIVGESGQVILCDINESMLSRGRDRLIDQGIINNVSYLQADAENLPFENESYDVVLNVESSHCYGDMQQFVHEVYRILKPGGYFSWADLRGAEEGLELPGIFKNAGFETKQEGTITPQVLHALDLIHDRKMDMIEENVPVFIQSAFKDFAGVKDSKIYNALKDGSAVYLRYVLQKPV